VVPGSQPWKLDFGFNNWLQAGIEATVFEQDASPTTRPRDWSFGVYWAQSPLADCLPPDLVARLPTVQTDPAFEPHKGEVLPIHHGETGELLRPVEAPYAVRYRRKAFLKLLSEGVDIRVRWTPTSRASVRPQPSSTDRRSSERRWLASLRRQRALLPPSPTARKKAGRF